MRSVGRCHFSQLVNALQQVHNRGIDSLDSDDIRLNPNLMKNDTGGRSSWERI